LSKRQYVTPHELAANLDKTTHTLPVSTLTRVFLSEEFQTSQHVLRQALSCRNGAETKPGVLRAILINALRANILESRLAARAKGGAPKKGKPQFVVFGEAVQGSLPRFSRAKQLAGSEKSHAERVRKLSIAGFSAAEIDCIVTGRNAKTAAVLWVSKKLKITFRAGQNYYSKYLAAKKQPSSSERHQ
jgi:hypothetical protein